MTVTVITISDRAFRGEYEDLTGPAVVEALSEGLPDALVDRVVVPDEAEAIRSALDSAGSRDVILTAGGTGLSDRDVTPETVAEWGDREVPGLAEYLRIRSLEETNRAALSRGVAVQRGSTLAITLPGSVRGARFCTQALVDLLPHAVSMMAGGGH